MASFSSLTSASLAITEAMYANAILVRETIYSHKLEYAHVTCDTAHACSHDRARSAGNIIMFR